MSATAVKSSVVTAVEITGMMHGGIARVMAAIMTVPEMFCDIRTFGRIEAGIDNRFFIARTHRLN